MQMLVPGFTVHELPLKLGNLNNVRYRHDGKLVALGYDGRIHLLSDTDGDGLEDKARVFLGQAPMRGPIGMALTAEGRPARRRRVRRAARARSRSSRPRSRRPRRRGNHRRHRLEGKLSRRRYARPRRRSERRRDLLSASAAPNFADAYLIDRSTGRGRATTRQSARHDSAADARTFRNARDRSAPACASPARWRSTAHGDLFATEQEGATWLPNGNPLDELLHIEPGKHYGFPPRHPKHLPDVIDEPAVIEYGPQHQSTVGMVFNEGVNGGPHFGPAHLARAMRSCAANRAENSSARSSRRRRSATSRRIISSRASACSPSMRASRRRAICSSPATAARPTGAPARRARAGSSKSATPARTLPQPVLAWAAAPDEFRIAFDRAARSADWARRQGAGADRSRPLRQRGRSLRDHPARLSGRARSNGHAAALGRVLGLSLSADQRTLVLRVPRQTEAVNYAITLPVPELAGERRHRAASADRCRRHAERHAKRSAGDGVRARAAASIACGVAKAFTAGSAEHAAFFAARRRSRRDRHAARRVDVSNPLCRRRSRVEARLGHRAATRSPPRNSVREDRSGATSDVTASAGRASGRKSSLPQSSDAPGASLVLARDDKLRPVRSPQRVFVPWATDRSPRKSRRPHRVAARPM